MRRPVHFPSPVTLALALGMVVQAAMTPLGAVARVPSTDTTLTPVPNNVNPDTDNAFVTAGDYIAFDFTFENTDNANISQMSLADSFAAGDVVPTYIGTFKTGGTLASQTVCSTGGEFSCNVGLVPDGATLDLRIVYRTTTTPGSFTLSVVGSTTGTPDTDPGTSHGDTFSVSTTVDTVDQFTDTGDLGTSGYLPITGDELQTSLANFGPGNPMWTHVNVPAAAMANLPIGDVGFLDEADSYPQAVCAAALKCFGQTSHISIAGGATMAAPFSVEIRMDNAKKFVSLNKWTLIHFPDSGDPADITTPCNTTSGPPTNAPCIQVKKAASDDKNDYIALVWLLENGWIRGH